MTIYMKIAIISDTHDNLNNFEKAVSWLKKRKIKTIIHCGDVCAPAVLKKAAENFSGRIHLVFGNADGDRFGMAEKVYTKQMPNVVIHNNDLGEIELEEKKIAFCHFPKFAQGLAATGKYDLVFYGHTHKPWEEKVGQCRLVNPGELAGLFYKATFAVYDFKKDKLELKILERL